MSNLIKRSFYSLDKEIRRREEIKLELCEFLYKYFLVWRRPLPYYILYRKFGQTLKFYGEELKDSIRELESKGLIKTSISENATVNVTPGVESFKRFNNKQSHSNK